jgi:hypothetical protein
MIRSAKEVQRIEKGNAYKFTPLIWKRFRISTEKVTKLLLTGGV